MINAQTNIKSDEMTTTYTSRHDISTAAGWTAAIKAVAPPLEGRRDSGQAVDLKG
jgi:hypothetical protein